MDTNKMYYFSLGFSLAIIFCMAVLTFYPMPEGEFACSKCNLSRWYFRPIE